MRILALAVPALALATACSVGAQPGDGERGRDGEATSAGEATSGGASGQRSFQVGEFHRVVLAGHDDVVVTVGGAPSVRAEGDAEALERLEIRVEDGSLRIGTERNGWGRRSSRGRAVVYVTAPSLDGASIGGSGDLRIDRVEAQRFAASIGGNGDMEIGSLRTRRADFSIAGSGNIRASGEAEEAEVSIAGSGDMALESLATRRADITVVGSGNVEIRASEAVDGSIMGSGDVTVHGSARCSVSRMGSGSVRCGA